MSTVLTIGAGILCGFIFCILAIVLWRLIAYALEDFFEYTLSDWIDSISRNFYWK